MPIRFQQSLADIARLVNQFNINRAAYLAPGFKEAQARQALIDPLFIALGWDVHLTENVAPDYQFVLVEENQHTAGHQRAPDYTFRTGRHDRKFFAEAKKPGVALKSSAESAYQLRSYGWNARLPLSILTDFDEFAVYNCRRKPLPKDKPNVARLRYYTSDEYADRWREIWDVFSLEAVRAGAFDQFARSGQSERGASTVDADFLETIEGWRKALAQNIELRNQLHEDDLTDAVQRTIDRLVFLRIAEDREIEPYEQLAEIGRGDGVYKRLAALFRKADKKYNSGLFNFESDRRALRMEVDDRVLRTIIADLYGAYNFRIMPVEILGNVYEQFLGKVIHVTAGGHAKVEAKPEVRKAGGVYYTPSYIVEYIVRHTVGKQVEGKSAKEVAKLRVLDMACGSGSFLLGAYQFLLDWHLSWYIEHEPQKQKTAVYDAGRGERAAAWRLTTEEKKRILLANIYGVDIDRQAVEVTKLSLLLKVLEDEQGESGQLSLLERDGERVLPDLDKNILCGNSLIAPDYFADSLLPTAEDMKRVNPFDWQTGFPEVMRAGGFDCVIGNPPYIRIQTMKEWAPLEVEIYKQKYAAAGSGNYDIYVVFVEKALSLLSESGRMGFILPHKFFNAQYGAPLRALVSEGKHLSEVVHFGDQQVFAGATTYTCLLFLDSQPHEAAHVVKVDDLGAWRATGKATAGDIAASNIGSAEWNFAIGKGAALFEKLSQMPVKLGDMADLFVGLQTDADDVYIVDEIKRDKARVLCQSKATGKQYWFEHIHLKQLLKGSVNIRRYSFSNATKRLIFPYETIGGKSLLIDPEAYKRRFPLTWAYLEESRDLLAKRNKGRMGQEWYGYVYKKNHTRFEQPKLLVPSIATGSAFAADIEGDYYFVGSGGGGGGGYGITLHSRINVSLPFILGLLNSRLLNFYLKQISTPFRGGFLALNRQYIEQLPIRPINFSDPADKARHDRMVALVERMLELHKRLHGAGPDSEREVLQRQVEAADRQIDALVYELYGLSEAEVAVVEG
jgi:Eco57I restriction-modification methylase/TaqI-like C-terminal specificity domain/N-6 DNA Methylase